MGKNDLDNAKKKKDDEFYTQYHDIQKEVEAYLEYNTDVFRGKTILLPCDDPEWSNFTKFFAQNFENFGLKKLISTSYASNSKKSKHGYQPTLFEKNEPQYDKNKTNKNGKIFTLTRDKNRDGKIDIDDLEWDYLTGDGDFRSNEVTKLRDEADIIITNPPFSSWRNFLAWIIQANKNFLILSNLNALAYKEVFPMIKNNKIWLGATNFNKGMFFRVPEDFIYSDTYKFDREQNGVKVNRVPSVCWMTNIDHGKRHKILRTMTMADNLKYNKKFLKKGQKSYEKYDNYDAIEVPEIIAIPSDYKGVMGVPITIVDQYNPNQFKIIAKMSTTKIDEFNYGYPYINGKKIYARYLIQKK